MDKIKIVIVDDHQIFREGFKLLLSRFSHIELIGEASDGGEFLRIMKDLSPDIVFMDISMPGINGIEATKAIMESHQALRVIALTTFLEEDYIEQMILAGVEGYMLKNSDLKEFEKAINQVYLGGNYFSEEIITILLGNINKFRKKTAFAEERTELSPKELEILELICKGMNNQQISEVAFMSVKTVEKYKSSLFSKTGTHNTVNLVIHAFKNQLVSF